jgi:hypothetical protein
MPKKQTIDEFIKRANIVHENRYDYSNSKYVNSHSKITVVCPDHGDFLVTPSHHITTKTGCQKCSGCHKYTTCEYIKKSKEVHGDKYDYTKTKYTTAHSKIIIGCPVHGDFEQKAYSHIQGTGCPQCSFEINGVNLRYTTDEIIEQCKAVHGDKFDYSKVNYIDNKSKIVIVCPIHGDFEQCVAEHKKSFTGCPACSNEIIQNTPGTYDDFIKRSFETHGDAYDYSLVKDDFMNFKSKVKIKCVNHGVFEQNAGSHFRGYGCPECSPNNRTITTAIIIDEFKKVHGYKYDYSKVNYVTTDHKVIISCPEHGDFKQSPSCHKIGQGCPECSPNNRKVTTDIIIKEFKEVHGDKYDYSKVNYVNSISKVIICCQIHGDFEQAPSVHRNGHECPRCYKGYSKISISWLKYIEVSRNIVIQHAENLGEFRVPGTRYDVDGYHAPSKTIYEFHGDYYHGNPKKYNQTDINNKTKKSFKQLYDNTVKKKQKCKELGYKYVEIWESDWVNAIKLVKLIQKAWRNNHRLC